MKMRFLLTAVFLAGLMAVWGCDNSNDDIDADAGASEADMAVIMRIDDTTSFVNLVDAGVTTNLTNANGIEIDPGTGVYTYHGAVYVTGSMQNDKVTKYTVTEDNSLVKAAETTVFQSGGSIPTSLIFVSDTKAYLALPGTGELLVIDPTDLSITKRIDLSPYALDADGETGGADTNPEPSNGVIRDGKLYLGLGQLDSFATYYCRGKASVLIIDTATDEVLKHITDDRTCTTGEIDPNNGLILDENGDIYINNTASFGYYPGLNAGILRINSGEDDFDPNYYFSITDIQDLDVAGGTAAYAYHCVYGGNGLLYTNLFIPALTSNPPDYVNDKNYQPYVLDLYNQTVEKLDTPPTIGWSSHLIDYDGEIVYGLTTVNGAGLYRAGETTPFMTTAGNPTMFADFD